MSTYSDDRGWCPECRALVGFRVSFRGQISPHYVVLPSGVPLGPSVTTPGRPVEPGNLRTTIRVLACMLCSHTVTVMETREYDDKGAGTVLRVEMIHPKPQPRALHAAIPLPVRSLFAEGSLCEEYGLLRGAAGLYRAAVEAMCDDLGAEGPNLYARIGALGAKGVDAGLIENLHQARTLGNYSLHEGIEFSAEEVADVAELIEEAFVLLYVQPHERARLRKARKARQPRS